MAEKEKVSFWKKVGSWFRSLKSEFKKIVWTPRKSVIYNSVLVIVAIVAFAVVIGLLDWIFGQGIGALAKIF